MRRKEPKRDKELITKVEQQIRRWRTKHIDMHFLASVPPYRRLARLIVKTVKELDRG